MLPVAADVAVPGIGSGEWGAKPREEAVAIDVPAGCGSTRCELGAHGNVRMQVMGVVKGVGDHSRCRIIIKTDEVQSVLDHASLGGRELWEHRAQAAADRQRVVTWTKREAE